MVAPPAEVAPGHEAGILQEPRVGVCVGMTLHQHGRVGARLRAGRAHGLGRADDVAHLPLLKDARAERGGHLVTATDGNDGIRVDDSAAQFRQNRNGHTESARGRDITLSLDPADQRVGCSRLGDRGGADQGQADEK